MRRRKVLVLAGTSLTAAIAGCGNGGEETTDDGADGGSDDTEEEPSDDGTDEESDDGMEEEPSDDGTDEESDGGESDDSSEEEEVPPTLVFSGSTIDPEQEEYEQGTEITISAVTSNDGTETFTGEFELLVDGESIATEEKELQGGSIRTLGVTWQIPDDQEPGEYEYTIRAQDVEESGTLTVIEAQEEDETAVEDLPEPEMTPEEVVDEFVQLTDEGENDAAYELYHPEGEAEEFTGTEEAFLDSGTLERVSDFERIVDEATRVVLRWTQNFDGQEDELDYDLRRGGATDGQWRIYQFGAAGSFDT